MEAAGVCLPSLQSACTEEEVEERRVEEVEQCYNITRTVCSQEEELVDREVCQYSQEVRLEEVRGSSLEVQYSQQCSSQQVTVCQPAQYGYGYPAGGRGRPLCGEVRQDTCLTSPSLVNINLSLNISRPHLVRTCSNQPVRLPRLTCRDVSSEKCVLVPRVRVRPTTRPVCHTQLAQQSCQDVTINLTKQSCRELVYGQTLQPQQPQLSDN